MHSHEKTLLSSLGFSDPDKKSPVHDLACQYLSTKEVRQKLADAFVGPSLSERPFQWKENKEYVRQDLSISGKKSGTMKVGGPDFERILSKGEGKYKTTVGFVDLNIGVEVEFHYSGTRDVASDVMYRIDSDGNEVDDERLGAIERRILRWYRDEHPRSPRYVLTLFIPGDIEAAKYESGLTALPSTLGSVYAHPDFPKEKRCRVVVSKEPYSHTARGERFLILEVKIAAVPVGDIVRQVNLYREHTPENTETKKFIWIVALAFDITPADHAMLKSSNIECVRLGREFEEWSEEQKRLKAESAGSNEPFSLTL